MLGRAVGNPAAVIAAWLELRATGWPCSVEIGKAEGRPAACLRLWGEPVLGTAPPALTPERCYEAGTPVRETVPRLPARSDGHVTQVSCSGSPTGDLTGLLEPLGGLGAVVRPGDSVLIKPNFNSYHPPPASTALDLASCVVARLREVGAARIAMGECSANSLAPTRGVVTRAGLTEWAAREGVEVILFDEESWRACPIPAGHWPHLLVPEALTRFDRLIYLASAKTHRAAGASLSLKLGVGLMHPVQRIALHANDLAERIAEIALAVRPDLAIVDARLCFVAGGPEVGETRKPGLLLAGMDLAALDSAALAVLRAHGASGLAGAEEQIEAARRAAGGNPAPREGVCEGCGELNGSCLSRPGGRSDA